MPYLKAAMTEASLLGLNATTEESIFLFGPGGEILLANVTAAGRLGKSPEEVMGTTIADYVQGDVYHARMSRLEAVIASGEPLQFEDTRDGIQFHHSLSPIKDSHGVVTAVACYSRDVSRQRSAEDALAASERQLRIALDSAELGTFDIDAATGAVRWDSRTMEIFGVTPADAPSLELAKSILFPEDWDGVEAAVAAAFDPGGDGRYEAEFRVRHGDGKVAWVLAKGRVHFEDEGGQRIPVRLSGVNSDVSQRKQHEEALRQSEEKFRLMGEIIPYGVWLCDAEGRAEYVSPSFLELLNMTQEEQRGFGWASRLPPEEVPGMMEKWLECVSTGRDWDSEHRILDRFGTVRTVLTRGKPVRDSAGTITAWAGVNLDITDRKRSEEALRVATEQSQFFSTALQNSSQPFAAGSPDGRLIKFNSAFVELTGYTEEELLDLKWASDLTPQEWREHEARVLEQLHQSGEAQIYEKEYKRKDGSRVPLELKVHLGRWPDGSVYYYSFVTDITERKKAAEELRRAHSDLEQRVAERTAELKETIADLHEKERLLIQQSRLAAMGEMINNIAHQWRQPLNGLGLVLQQIKMAHELGQLDSAELEQSVEAGMKMIQHMSETVDDFRHFLKPDKKKVRFKIRQVVEKTLRLVEPTFKYLNISIKIVHHGDPVATGYPNEYCQVIMNVLNNAKEAFMERALADALIEVAVTERDGRSEVTISDNAGGIPADIIDRVFEPKFSTKPNGTGIGLFMSKGIIESGMNGNLTVSNTGAGAAFQILL